MDPVGGWLSVCLIAGAAIVAGAVSLTVVRRGGSPKPGGGNRHPAVSGDGDANLITHFDVGLFGRPFVQRPVPFAVTTIAVIVGLLICALVVSGDGRRLLASVEWQCQPIYLAAHLLTVRYFLRIFALNYLAGVRHLDMTAGEAQEKLRHVLGSASGAAALVLAVPFGVIDLRYVQSQASAGSISALDLLLWGVWAIEWVINALVWVTVVRFYWLNRWTLTCHRFRAPIHTVVLRKHYRPFLRMSSQGSGVVMLFAGVNILYIAMTGGDLGDYLGLAITASLVGASFLATWALVRSQISGALDKETSSLQDYLAEGRPDTQGSEPDISRRLDEVLAMLRVSYLDGLNHRLGMTEARAVLFRIAAPALTAAWQISSWSPATRQTMARWLLEIRRLMGL